MHMLCAQSVCGWCPPPLLHLGSRPALAPLPLLLLPAITRVVEYLAVLRLRGTTARAPILCFIGAPGVGKTSLARSVAEVLGRPFARWEGSQVWRVHGRDMA